MNFAVAECPSCPSRLVSLVLGTSNQDCTGDARSPQRRMQCQQHSPASRDNTSLDVSLLGVFSAFVRLRDTLELMRTWMVSLSHSYPQQTLGATLARP